MTHDNNTAASNAPQDHTNDVNASITRRGGALDPNVAQGHASDPTTSVWVSASAGTGKTKVLTDRILRLLLPRADGQRGAAIHKILCLTFTKAAASEMALRLHHTLSAWSTAADDVLHENLSKLLKRNVSDNDKSIARQLFSQIADSGNDLKIQTIHAFCQSVLSRFPLESSLAPYHQIIEERDATALFDQSLKDALYDAQRDKGSPAHQGFTRLSQTLNETHLTALIRSICAERIQLSTLKTKHFSITGLYEALCRHLNIEPHSNPERSVFAFCHDDAFDKIALTQASESMLQHGSKRDNDRATNIRAFLHATPDVRANLLFTSYHSAFFKKNSDEPYKSLITKNVIKNDPHCLDALEQEVERITAAKEHIRKIKTAEATHDILNLSHRVIDAYNALKTKRSVLDFEDMIYQTMTLLEKEGGLSWVMYKMDSGLDHILVDEAQDTNPEQWNIIQTLCDEFFSGAGARTGHSSITQSSATNAPQESNRSLFVVGDEKQSIYSFQRASPEKFTEMHTTLKAKADNAGTPWVDVNMNISFRTNQTVLNVVDAVFPKHEHHSFRVGQAGLVELWGLYKNEDTETPNPWEGPLKIWEKPSSTTILAQNIAKKIKHWLITEEHLHSRNRTIQPRDIMILVRTRAGTLVHDIIRQCKLLSVPIGGIDRLILGDDIAVQDLLTCARFALNPEDELNLACLLKSPLINMSENILADLAIDREGSLWESLSSSMHHMTVAYLNEITKCAQTLDTHSFFTHILHTPCPADVHSGLKALQRRLGQACLDPISEFINTALGAQKNHAPTLHDFLHWFTADDIEIKRTQDAAQNVVRIMTVHGAKGLQAPIVILPDTVSTPESGSKTADKRFLWPDKTGQALPLFCPRSADECTQYTTAMDTVKSREMAEYSRLLYVAMTRAEDRLYVTGAQKSKAPSESCWYETIKRAVAGMNDVESINNGGLRLYTPPTREGDRSHKDTHLDAKNIAPLPDWAYIPHTKNSIKTQLKSFINPYDEGLEDRSNRARGTLIHKLLEIIPALTPQERTPAITAYLTRRAADLTSTEHGDIAAHVLRILDNPAYVQFFTPNSRAEVPITYINDNGVHTQGTIDRLVVENDAVWILDYKTERTPPKNVDNIPHHYRDQVMRYKAAIMQVYPNHAVKAAILWTQTLTLMEII